MVTLWTGDSSLGTEVHSFPVLQHAEDKQREKAERLRFGRFFYRFPNGESGADVSRVT